MSKATVEPQDVQEPGVEVKKPKGKKEDEVKTDTPLALLARAEKLFQQAKVQTEDHWVEEAKLAMADSVKKAKAYLEEMATWRERHSQWLKDLQAINLDTWRGRIKEHLLWRVGNYRAQLNDHLECVKIQLDRCVKNGETVTLDDLKRDPLWVQYVLGDVKAVVQGGRHHEELRCQLEMCLEELAEAVRKASVEYGDVEVTGVKKLPDPPKPALTDFDVFNYERAR